mmetsp:Transcript_67453/g.135899  ORF Transcript_67453/g.135899 Transcript_67453/m.135899 type:complete len:208 (-) Transcript_67453:220-843(-)
MGRDSTEFGRGLRPAFLVGRARRYKVEACRPASSANPTAIKSLREELACCSAENSASRRRRPRRSSSSSPPFSLSGPSSSSPSSPSSSPSLPPITLTAGVVADVIAALAFVFALSTQRSITASADFVAASTTAVINNGPAAGATTHADGDDAKGDGVGSKSSPVRSNASPRLHAPPTRPHKVQRLRTHALRGRASGRSMPRRDMVRR